MSTSLPHWPRAIVRRLRAFVGNPYAKISAGLAPLAMLTWACGSDFSPEAANRQGWDNFQTAVASDRNYDVYWMGRQFTVAGLTYAGPDVPGIGGQVDGGGFSMVYVAPLGTGGGVVDVEVTLYSTDAWTRRQASRAAAALRLETKPVQLNGESATLGARYDSDGKVGVRVLTVDYGRTVVEATTGSFVPNTPGPEPNPLIDEDTFLAAMQNLRPYPE